MKLRSPDGSLVSVSDAQATRLRRRGWVPEASVDEPEHRCADCEFVAKTAAGLGAHRRTHEE